MPRKTEAKQTTEDPVVRVQIVDRRATVPVKKHANDAGFDLVALEDFILRPWDSIRISTGLAIGIPRKYFGQVEIRSSLGEKGMIRHGGVIDCDYTGPIELSLRNVNSKDDIVVKAGERIAQIIFIRILAGPLIKVKRLPQTARGDGGFGSTGKGCEVVSASKHRRGRSSRTKKVTCSKKDRGVWEVRSSEKL